LVTDSSVAAAARPFASAAVAPAAFPAAAGRRRLQVLGSDVIAGCDEDDGYGTLRTKAKDEEDDNRDAWRFAVSPVLLPVKSTLVAWTCAPGFDVSPTVTTNVRTVANVPNISTYLPARNTTVFLAR
jgi:hypothetical protein